MRKMNLSDQERIDRHRKQDRDSYLRHRIERIEYQKNNYKIKRDDILHGTKNRFKIYFRNAARRGLEFGLSLEEFTVIVSKPCCYCGDSGVLIGIDRIDNSVGYTLRNIAPCCSPCNYAKRMLSASVFIDLCRKVAIKSWAGSTNAGFVSGIMHVCHS